MSHFEKCHFSVKIVNAFKHKTWNEIKSSDSWQIFKIMAEFVEGYEQLSKIGPCVSIFGSASQCNVAGQRRGRSAKYHPDSR